MAAVHAQNSTGRVFDLRHRMPAEVLADMRITGLGPGWSEGVVRLPSPAAGAPPLSLGWLGTLADATAGRPLLLALPADRGCRTVNIRLDAAGAPLCPGDLVTARGEVLDVGSDFALGRSTLRASDGALLAVATARFAVVPEADSAPGDAAGEAGDGPRAGTLAELLEVREERVTPGEVALSLVPGPRLANQYGVVHGGMHVALADLGLTAAAGSVGAGSATVRPTPADLTVVYHRPIPVDGARLVLRATVERHGRRVTIAAATVTSADGRLLTSAYGTLTG